MGTLLMGSFLDLGDPFDQVRTIRISSDGSIPVLDREREVVMGVREEYARADILIGHYILAFDAAWTRGISARHRLERPPKRMLLDTHSIARYGLKGALQSCSLDNVADFFGVGVKDRPSKHDWRGANTLDEESLQRIQARCESDVCLNAAIWPFLKEHWFAWRGV
jgi:DNA polymerase III epsilon subunit-like protein